MAILYDINYFIRYRLADEETKEEMDYWRKKQEWRRTW